MLQTIVNVVIVVIVAALLIASLFGESIMSRLRKKKSGRRENFDS